MVFYHSTNRLWDGQSSFGALPLGQTLQRCKWEAADSLSPPLGRRYSHLRSTRLPRSSENSGNSTQQNGTYWGRATDRLLRVADPQLRQRGPEDHANAKHRPAMPEPARRRRATTRGHAPLPTSSLLSRLRSTRTPALPSTPLPQTKEKLSKGMEPTAEEQHKHAKLKAIYQENLGIALWIFGQTRPDCAAAVSILSRFTANPGVKHMKALKHLARYLHGARALGLHYRRRPKPPAHQLTGWSDSDWAGGVDTAKSTSGFMAELNDGIVKPRGLAATEETSWATRRVVVGGGRRRSVLEEHKCTHILGRKMPRIYSI